jgi:hypothetical protein
MELPKVLLVLAVTLFVASVLGTFAALVVFFYYDVTFWYFFDPGPVLRMAAAILAGLCVSSGVIFVHLRSQESYLTLESIFFLVCFALALVNLLWIAPVLLFL